MNKQQKKIVRWVLVAISIVLLMLIVILTPIMTEIEWGSDKPTIDKNASNIALMVLIPFLSSVISFFISEKFMVTTLQEQKNRAEKMLNEGYISIEKYIDIIKYLDDFDLQKRNAKIEIETKKEIAKIEMEAKVNEAIKNTKNEIKAKIQETQEDEYDDEYEEKPKYQRGAY